jgi:hypothetical protein
MHTLLPNWKWLLANKDAEAYFRLKLGGITGSSVYIEDLGILVKGTVQLNCGVAKVVIDGINNKICGSAALAMRFTKNDGPCFYANSGSPFCPKGIVECLSHADCGGNNKCVDLKCTSCSNSGAVTWPDQCCGSCSYASGIVTQPFRCGKENCPWDWCPTWNDAGKTCCRRNSCCNC